MIRVALDTNILVYAEGLNGASKKKFADGVIQKLPHDSVVLPVQVLGELFNVLVRKAGKTTKVAGSVVLGWHASFPVIETSALVIWNAIDLVVSHKIRIWDAIILASAASAGCRFLLSEDLHDGFTWGGVTVVNPFLDSKPAMLEAILSA
jgi:predicted nucleic acid-binding protein